MNLILVSDITDRRTDGTNASEFFRRFFQPRLEKATEELAGVGAVSSAVCDVTDEDQVQALVTAGEAAFGSIDVWINNAGLGGSSSIITMTDEAWRRAAKLHRSW